MKSNLKVSFCTDFSETADAALEMLLFNAWSFKVDIDIIHLVENMSYNEVKIKLDNLHKELNVSLCGAREIRIIIFEKGSKLSLISHLNDSHYFLNIVGLDGLGKTAGIGSFLALLYKYYKGGLVVVPKNHALSIENKVLIGLAYENIERIHYLKKVAAFLYFNFSKLNILIRVKEEVSCEKKVQTTEVIEGLFPGLVCEISFQKPEDCTEYIKHLFSEKNINYSVVFKGDYFDDFSRGVMENRSRAMQPKEMLLRVCTANRIISAIKANDEGVIKMDLRDF
ncbi:hypothetical protein [Arcticibacterium luteifluviistationis]|uniref:UspA domain-containing protein n=1 Tax=Arcticibacterium luteifluviistationis TaxID=1784714 RepID=A0A2Z4G8E4_9BACT|nr:hypothetical protein [Arcticibacterium luteifluviistationis]AWV97365.1 hypothetical protein DJ013_03935 [Arcticibacterium luteifluviistationis]